MQDRRTASTSKAPGAIGPYSQAIHASRMCCSGQVALDPTTQSLVAGGIKEQTKQVLKNLGQVLAATGSPLERVLGTTVHCVMALKTK